MRNPHESPRTRLLRPACLALATALAVAAPLVPSERTELTGTGLPPTMLWLFAALVWFGGAWLTRQPIRRLKLVDFTAIACGCWIAASGVLMMNYGAARPTINAIWTWAGMIAAFLLLRQLLRSEREVRALCAVMIGLAVCLSIMAIHQRFVRYPAMRALYERDPDEVLRQAGISAPPGTAQRQQFEARLNSPEPTATFSLTNSLAGFVATWLVLLMGILVAASSSRRAATGFFALLLLVCLLLTQSRSAWLATLVGIGCIVAIAGGQRPARVLPLAAASVIVAGFLLLGTVAIFPSIFTSAWRSLAFRLEYWQATLAMIADYPLWGVGVGNFQEYYTAYKLPQASEAIADPHNFLLEIAATAGVPSLLLFVAFTLWISLAGGQRPALSSPVAKDNTAAETTDHVALRAISVGGVLGIPLAIMLGLVTGYFPDIFPLLLGAATGALAVWLLREWVEHGPLPRWLIVVAVVVLLVNLLAAGGISFPGVAITLWVLLAGGQRPASSELPVNQEENGTGRAGRWPPAIAGVVALVLLGMCYATAYQPVLARTQLTPQAGDAQFAGRFDDAMNIAAANAAADPWSAEPHWQLAQLYFERWWANASPRTGDDDFQAFETHATAALHRNRRSSQQVTAIGYYYWEAYTRTREPRLRDTALRLASQAVKLYPHEPLGRAQHAWLLAGTGRTLEAQREAAEALRLDGLCPHTERKLDQRRLFAEVANAAQQARMPSDLRTQSAEQLLRNK